LADEGRRYGRKEVGEKGGEGQRRGRKRK